MSFTEHFVLKIVESARTTNLRKYSQMRWYLNICKMINEVAILLNGLF